ncbi:MAG: PEGA domain-containing protein [Magnetococcales bacterium]|nr:PEGA domain-containing protein [Magnetococcales bacterium]
MTLTWRIGAVPASRDHILSEPIQERPGRSCLLACDLGGEAVVRLGSAPGVTRNQPGVAAKRVATGTGVLLAAGISWLEVMLPSGALPLMAWSFFAPSPVVASVDRIPDRPSEDSVASPAGVRMVAQRGPVASGAREEVSGNLWLRVESRPVGAVLFMDGKRMGITPFSLAMVKAGHHKLRLEKERCNPVELELALTRDTLVDLTLERLPLSPDHAQGGRRPPVEATSPIAPVQERKVMPGQQQQEEIASLMALAEAYFKAGHLTKPGRRNALMAYQTVLAMDQRHPGASQGVRRIVERLLALARDDLENWRLVSPLENNALERFRIVLEIDGKHPEARAGLEEIVDRLLTLARRFAADDARKALAHLKQAEEVLPGVARVAETRAILFPKRIRIREPVGHPVGE